MSARRERFTPMQVASGPACVHPTVDPDWFFPHQPKVDLEVPADYKRLNDRNTLRAKTVCASCPIRAKCLDDNLTVEFGIYGGHTAGERAVIALQRGVEWPEHHKAMDEVAIDKAMAFEQPKLSKAERKEVARRMARLGYKYDQMQEASRLNGTILRDVS